MRNGPYELVIAPGDYPGKKYRGRYCYEHHLVWWRATGQLVADGHCIHHKNGQKRDNRIENLEMLSLAAHNSEHAAGPDITALSCAWCGVEFVRETRNVRHARKKGRTRFHCSRSCSVRNQHQRARVIPR